MGDQQQGAVANPPQRLPTVLFPFDPLLRRQGMGICEDAGSGLEADPMFAQVGSYLFLVPNKALYQAEMLLQNSTGMSPLLVIPDGTPSRPRGLEATTAFGPRFAPPRATALAHSAFATALRRMA
jgi:hypothetical protein